MFTTLFFRDHELAEADVWRIEHPNGRGPYHFSSLDGQERYEKYPWLSQLELKWYHPMPDRENGVKKRFATMKKDAILDDVFGFPSVEAYIKWFNKPWWRRRLEEAGLSLVKYRAKRVAMGTTQCIFNRKEAVELAKYTPTAFDAEYGSQWEFR